MKTVRLSRNSGIGVSTSAFEDDGIPNSPFKSSKSAAFTFAMFGVILGGLMVFCGIYAAFQQHLQKPTAPVQIVQESRAGTSTYTAPQSIPVGAASANAVRRRLHAQHAKKLSKAKLAASVK
jgi:hypothetical protein